MTMMSGSSRRAARRAVYMFVRDIPRTRQHASYPALRAIESNLAQFGSRPMLILWGGRDIVFTPRRFLDDWRTHFPQADVTVFDDAGHYVIEDAHERIVPRLLSFLAQTD